MKTCEWFLNNHSKLKKTIFVWCVTLWPALQGYGGYTMVDTIIDHAKQLYTNFTTASTEEHTEPLIIPTTESSLEEELERQQQEAERQREKEEWKKTFSDRAIMNFKGAFVMNMDDQHQLETWGTLTQNDVKNYHAIERLVLDNVEIDPAFIQNLSPRNVKEVHIFEDRVPFNTKAIIASSITPDMIVALKHFVVKWWKVFLYGCEELTSEQLNELEKLDVSVSLCYHYHWS